MGNVWKIRLKIQYLNNWYSNGLWNGESTNCLLTYYDYDNIRLWNGLLGFYVTWYSLNFNTMECRFYWQKLKKKHEAVTIFLLIKQLQYLSLAAQKSIENQTAKNINYNTKEMEWSFYFNFQNLAETDRASF